MLLLRLNTFNSGLKLTLATADAVLHFAHIAQCFGAMPHPVRHSQVIIYRIAGFISGYKYSLI